MVHALQVCTQFSHHVCTLESTHGSLVPFVLRIQLSRESRSRFFQIGQPLQQAYLEACQSSIHKQLSPC